jgi:opacity protein-like surface antigen
VIRLPQEMSMKLLTTLLVPLALAMPVAPAQASDLGPYAIVAVGSTDYDFDCYFFSSCSNTNATSGKLIGGVKYGVFAIEVSYADWGKGSAPYGNSLRLRSLGVNGAWHLHFNPSVQVLLRAGFAQVWQDRSDDGRSSHLEGTFGLGLSVGLTQAVAVELAWDATTSTGNNSGSVLAQSVTAGLRLRF